MKTTYFQDKTIWITGASSGIGESFAKKLSALGAYVILSARRKGELERVKSSLAHPAKSEIAIIDMLSKEEIDLVSKRLLSKHQIDIIFLNAGISQRSKVVDTQFETEALIMNTNFHGLIRLAKHVLPSMIDRKDGHFVVMSSVTGKIGVPGRSSYSASKHALHGYFDSLRAEVSDDGISVTIVCPGYVYTNISSNAILGNGEAQNTIDEDSKNGMNVEKFVHIATKGIAKRREELLIGGREVLGVYLKRFFPRILSKLLQRKRRKDDKSKRI